MTNGNGRDGVSVTWKWLAVSLATVVIAGGAGYGRIVWTRLDGNSDRIRRNEAAIALLPYQVNRLEGMVSGILAKLDTLNERTARMERKDQ